jgi:eukaryotic-like serine/threonine-protein kinase
VTMSTARSVTATFDKASSPSPKACVVPKVVGKTLKAARKAISAHACGVGKVKHAFSKTVKKGRVVSQKPKPRKRLKHGAKVTLVISKGKH